MVVANKRRAQTLVREAIAAAALIREPCAICGRYGVNAHHEDYFKPLEVVWLCPTHHNHRHQGHTFAEMRKAWNS